MHWGKKFAEVLRFYSITQAEAARRYGVTQPAISRYCQMKDRPPQRTIGRLAKSLGIPLAELYRGLGPIPVDPNIVVRESSAEYGATRPYDAPLLKLKRRWQRADEQQRAQILLALQALHGEDSKTIVSWLNS